MSEVIFMEANRAIPAGYMTVGEVAKKMNTTVRTLQYYDKQGLLAPSAESEGGRRLYTDKDMIRLYQIVSLKYLGFSLGDIKHRLITLDSPTDVADMLMAQAAAIREKAEALSESLSAIEALSAEVLQMQSVDFKRYADIIMSLRVKNENYWMLKYFDDQFLDHIRNRFSGLGSDMGIMATLTRLQEEAIRLRAESVAPESEKGQAFAREFWDMVLTFTGGDMSLLPKMIEIDQSVENWDEKWTVRNREAKEYISQTLDVYFKNLGYDPFEEEQKQ